MRPRPGSPRATSTPSPVIIGEKVLIVKGHARKDLLFFLSGIILNIKWPIPIDESEVLKFEIRPEYEQALSLGLPTVGLRC